MRNISNIVKKSIQGYRRYYSDKQKLIRLARKLFPRYEIDMIFDIGANAGMSGQFFRDIGYNNHIISFEPLKHLYDQLVINSAKDKLWHTKNIALGDEPGQSEINVSGDHGGASSILKMTDNVIKHAPLQRVIRKEKIIVETLDSVIDQLYPKGDRLFLKIDTQGYEKKVLEGASNSLNRIIGLKLEMSLVPNYEGETLMMDLIPWIYDLGFRLVYLENGWNNRNTGELFQADGLFFRTDRLSEKH